MTRFSFSAAAVALVFSAAGVAQAAPAESPPSGSYACMTGSGMLLGFLEINGRTYRGIAHTPAGAHHPIVTGADGAMSFPAGLGGLSSSGAKVGVAKYMGTKGSSGSRPWIAVHYVSPRGNNERLDCEKQ